MLTWNGFYMIKVLKNYSAMLNPKDGKNVKMRVKKVLHIRALRFII